MVIVLAWLNLLGDIRQLPFLGIYVIMFFDILNTFLKFVGVFIVFIVAFALGFHTLLITKGEFFEMPSSMLKTTVMMIGEFEFESNLYPRDTIPYPEATSVLFVIFLVIMSIIIMNLLVGLAVDDIKAVQEQAVLQRLAMQVELVLDAERLFPTFWLARTQSQYDTIVRKARHWWSIFTDVVSSRSIVRDVLGYRRTIELEDVAERQELMEEHLKGLRADVKRLTAEAAGQRALLRAFAKKRLAAGEEADAVDEYEDAADEEDETDGMF